MRYFADFETTVPASKEDLDLGRFTETRVWAAALGPIGGDEEDIVYFNNIKDFLDYCVKLPDRIPEIYFHNLKFDGAFILYYLLFNKFDVKKGRQRLANNQLKACIGDGMYYSLKICYKKKTILFKDSLKILPFSEEQIGKAFKTRYQKLVGSIDYAKYRPIGYEMDSIEKKYLTNDLMIMMEALKHLEDRGMLERLTIGSLCLEDYSKGLIKQGFKFENLFPQLSGQEYKEIKPSYKGGWCFCKEERANVKNVKGNTYDVNSLYPWSMHSLSDEELTKYKKLFPEVKYLQHLYPYGCGERAIDIEEIYEKMENKLFIINFNCNIKLKKDHLPFLQKKDMSIYSKKDNIFIFNEDNLNLTLTAPAWELMFEQYDVEVLDINYAYFFNSGLGLFDYYIDKWYNEKRKSEEEKNPIMRQISKLYLNNLGGKFGTSVTGNSGIPCIDKENNTVRISNESCIKENVYLPVAAFMTDYARCLTIRSAQINYDNFYYADTDSIHILGEAKSIFVGKELGEWKNESTWDKARFIRQKTYCEHIIKDNGAPVEPFWNIKACGCPDASKERLLYKVELFEPLNKDENDNILNEKRTDDEIMERFDYGLIESGKLTSKMFPGGKILYDSTFTLVDI